MLRIVLLVSLFAAGPLLSGCTNPTQPRSCSASVGDRTAPQSRRPATKDAGGDYVCE